MTKYKTKKGDSWIKVANDNGISVDDLLYWNGIDASQGIPAMQLNQELYTSNPYILNSSYVTANAPKNYADYGQQGQQKMDMYARAVKQGQMRFNDVPKEYQSAVNQRMITQGTDKFANHALNVGSNIAMLLMNPAAYTAGMLAQKGTAYTTDALSGRNEYGVGDVLGYTPVMGREHAQEHPGKAAAVDMATGIFGGSVLRNLKNFANPAWRQTFSQAFKANAQNATGLSNGIVHENPVWQINKGNVFQAGTKGWGKTGNKVIGSPSGGWGPVFSAKATFNHAAGTNMSPAGVQSVIYGSTTAMPSMSIPIGYPGVVIPTQPLDPVTVVSPEKRIYEQQSFNAWQGNNPGGGPIAPMIPGTGITTITGYAPVGQSIDGQALTNESLNYYDHYMPRTAIYVPGSVNGTPSNIHSGLGHTYDSQNPGNLIIK